MGVAQPYDDNAMLDPELALISRFMRDALLFGEARRRCE
jgi:hypothetical protein